MANPRTGIDFTNVGAERVTLKADGSTLVYDATVPGGSAHVGKAVSIVGDQTIRLGADNDVFFGVLVSLEPDGKATVQYRGFMSVAGTIVHAAGVQCAAAGAVKTGTRGIVVDDSNPGWFLIP